MPQRIEYRGYRLPFTIYDFLVHFIPGILFAFLFNIILEFDKIVKYISSNNETNIEFLLLKLSGIFKEHRIIGIIFLIVGGYILGQALSAFGSAFIEKLFIKRLFNYPSYNLLCSENNKKTKEYLRWFILIFTEFYFWFPIIYLSTTKLYPVLKVLFSLSLAVAFAFVTYKRIFQQYLDSFSPQVKELFKNSFKKVYFEIDCSSKLPEEVISNDIYWNVFSFIILNHIQIYDRIMYFVSLYSFYRTTSFTLLSVFGVIYITIFIFKKIYYGSILWLILVLLTTIIFVFHVMFWNYIRIFKRQTEEMLRCFITLNLEHRNEDK